MMDARRFLCCLAEVDFACLAHIMRAHGHSRRSDTVRFAIQQQRLRSSARGALAQWRMLVRSAKEGVGASGHGRIMKRWHQLYTEDDFAALAFLVRRHELGSTANAVRFAIRAQAVHDGYKGPLQSPPLTPPNRTPAPRPAPRPAPAPPAPPATPLPAPVNGPRPSTVSIPTSRAKVTVS